jgi:hypothetical protein
MTAHRSKSLRFNMLLAVGIAAAIAVGCGGKEDAPDPTAVAPTPSATPKAASLPTDAGAIAAREREERAGRRESGRQGTPRLTRIVPEAGSDTIELPADFPVDVPLHPSGSPTRYVSSRKSGTMTLLVVDESADSARRFYTGALEDEGWLIEMDGASSDLMMLSASKGGRSLAVAITEVDGETTVTLIESSE